MWKLRLWTGVCFLPACLYSEAGVFLSRERAGVTVETTGLPPPGDGTESNSQENSNNTDSSDIINQYPWLSRIIIFDKKFM